MRLPPKYIIVPGFIKSKNDGDIHYVTYDQLLKLYGLDRKECVWIPEHSLAYVNNKLIPKRFSDLPVLRPLHSGKYREYIADLNKGSK